jgi:hypothetical protein
MKRLPPGFEEPNNEPAIAVARRYLRMASTSTRERFNPESRAWVSE